MKIRLNTVCLWAIGFLLSSSMSMGAGDSLTVLSGKKVFDSLRTNALQAKEVKISLSKKSLPIQNFFGNNSPRNCLVYLVLSKKWIAINSPSGTKYKMSLTDSIWANEILKRLGESDCDKKNLRVMVSEEANMKDYIPLFEKANQMGWGPAIFYDALKRDHFSIHARPYVVENLMGKESAQKENYVWAGENSEIFLNGLFDKTSAGKKPSAKMRMSRTQEDIADPIHNIQNKLRQIYTKYFGTKVFEGKMVFQIIVNPAGKVGSVIVQSGTMNDKSFIDDTVDEIKRLEFVAIQSTQPDTVNMPFDFIK